MLLQGQEFAASAPFLYFADHKEDLAPLVRSGRLEFLSQFPNLVDPAIQDYLPVPHDQETFHRCRLDLSERQKHAWAYDLHRDLLRLRREDPVFRVPRPRGLDGAVLGPQALMLRFFGDHSQDRLLLVNLGRDLSLRPAPEPLLAPPENHRWQLAWSSEHPRYGGCGTAWITGEKTWCLPAEAALVFVTTAREDVADD